MLQQGAAGTVHHAFGPSGGTRGVHDVERMFERQPREGRRVRRRVLREHIAEQNRAGQRLDRRRGADIRHHPHGRQRRQRRDHLAHAVEAVDLPAGVPVSICRDQDLGRDLSEAIEYPFGTEIG